MKTFRKLLATTTAAVVMPAMAWAADEVSKIEIQNPDEVTQEEIRSALLEAGFTDVTRISGAGRYYMIHAYRGDVYTPMTLDIETGEMTAYGHPDDRTISILGRSSKEDIANELRVIGYSDVEVGPKQGRYIEATGWRYGKYASLSIDLDTGLVTNADQDETRFVPLHTANTRDAVKSQLEALGYTEVQEIHHTGNGWRAIGIENGQRVDIYVDGETGEVFGWKKGNGGAG